MIEYGLVGERLGHSFSPEIHSMIGNYKYELIEVPKDEIDAFFDRREFSGLNVTIPYKETVIPHLDRIDDAARDIGAVNTVVVRDGVLSGYNTDRIGMQTALLSHGIDVAGKKVLVLGTGGTSKTASYVAKHLGASEIVLLSRSEKEGCTTYRDAPSLHGDAGVIINTTPAGMFPDVYSTPIDLSDYPNLTGVFDAVFNPLRTRLVTEAKERGLAAAGGLFMLVSQAIAASEIFKGTKCSKGLHAAIYSKIVRERENVVLTGMPSSGKSSVGREVAKALGREIVDTDEIIVKNEGMPITEIFKLRGEEYFREAEERAVKEAASRQGIVIATGGGAVMRRENVLSLKQNGRIYFLDRSIERLTATSDRPLSSDIESLRKRYDERIGTYLSTCDVTVDSNGTVEEAAKKVTDEFNTERII